MRESTKRRHVLLIEDDPELRDNLSECLNEVGFEVLTAPDGRIALEHLHARWPADVIVLDLMMPVMNGWEFRVAQRDDPVLSRIPVVVASAATSAQALAIDADARLTKPVQIEDLVRCIHDVIIAKEREHAGIAQEHADRLATLGSLAAGVLHDIGNPLTAVVVNAETARRLLDDEWPGCRTELGEVIGDVSTAADTAMNIVRQASRLSRFTERAEALDLREVLEAAVALTRTAIRRRAELFTEHADVSRVRARKSSLLQVFVNLLVNAADAIGSEKRGRITTRVFEEATRHRVIAEISDTGSGIAPHLLDRIFDPFFTTKTSGQGTGLGLWTCRRIVSELGGDIDVESELGRGTTFRVELPIATDVE